MHQATFRLDADDERLWKGGRPVPISNKAFRLLRLFVHNPNRLLTKDHILAGVWPDSYVTEGLVKEYVHDLRVALDDDPRRPRFIETVHGRGYRFLGGIEEGRDPVDSAPPAERGARPPSLVVLPFTNLTEDARWTRFCRGLGDDLVIDLARYPDLMVVANKTSSALDAMDVRDIGRELGVGYALNGSVQASDSHVRVNVKLIETRNGHHLWTEQYERDLGAFFEIQNDIVGHVVSTVGGFDGQIPRAERLRLERKPPADLQAYELYLLGYELEFRFEKESALRALSLLERATALDPGFARAWLLLGWTCWQIALERWTEDTQRYRDLQHQAFKTAASLDPLDPFAVMELAVMRAIDGDLTGVHDALERALDLGQNQADLLIKLSNYIATVMDDPDRAIRVMDHGLALPASISKWHHLTAARVCYFAGGFERSAREAELAAASLPMRLFRLLSTAQLGRRAESDRLARDFRARHPRFEPAEYIKDHPITAPNARRLFLEGVERAGLQQS